MMATAARTTPLRPTHRWWRPTMAPSSMPNGATRVDLAWSSTTHWIAPPTSTTTSSSCTPASWRIQESGRGFLGYAAQWDADPGPAAPRTASALGSLPLPGPGRHTLHLRVFDGHGTSTDIAYLYLYDTGQPTATLAEGQVQ